MSTDPSRRDFSLESVRRDSSSFQAARAYRSLGLRSALAFLLLAAAGYVLLLVVDSVAALREPSLLRMALRVIGRCALFFGISSAFFMLILGEFSRLRAISPGLGDRTHAPKIRAALWLLVVMAFIAFVSIIPICFGSLQAGTYECKTIPEWLFH